MALHFAVSNVFPYTTLFRSNPNLQNIPIRTERGREVRKAFIPSDDGHVILSADYSQIELRLVAHMSGNKGMLEAFEKGLDVHRRSEEHTSELQSRENLVCRL